MSEFAGKNVLVLGGSRGIGAAIVRRFASEGAKTAFTYLGSAKAAEALAAKTGAEAIPADSADRATLVKTVADRGALDVIVISAGALVMGDPLTLDADAVDGLIDVNVRAPYHAAVEAARRMNPGGRIIVIGSTNGDRIPFAAAAPMRSPNRRCRAWCAAWRATSVHGASPSMRSSQGRPTAT